LKLNIYGKKHDGKDEIPYMMEKNIFQTTNQVTMKNPRFCRANSSDSWPGYSNRGGSCCLQRGADERARHTGSVTLGTPQAAPEQGLAGENPTEAS
jgi:hypothetical protein